jgi:thiol:disulfide interchange protein DsbD
VNKKIVLETSAFEKLAQDEGIKLMRADWTKRDPKITTFLKSYNIIGVPAYFVKSKSGKLINLGETISFDEISKAINR